MTSDELKAYINGRRVVASISGGKDSAAMGLYLKELGIEYERVFLDTKWEQAKVYEYLRGDLAQALGPITEIAGPLGMEELIEKKKTFPSKRRRFCTEELKAFPIQKHIRSIVDAGEDVINAVGIRRSESVARSKLAEWEWSDSFDCEVWRPLIDWSTQDVIDIHARHGLRPNPLYLLGASRVGCWPCIYARKSEIRFIAEHDPARIDQIRELEARVGDLARGRHSERLRVFKEGGGAALSTRDRTALLDDNGQPKPFHQPSWFQAPLGDTGDPWPIDRVVEWSRTTRGGKNEDKQEDMFAGMDGCMRWGLCDTGDES